MVDGARLSDGLFSIWERTRSLRLDTIGRDEGALIWRMQKQLVKRAYTPLSVRGVLFSMSLFTGSRRKRADSGQGERHLTSVDEEDENSEIVRSSDINHKPLEMTGRMAQHEAREHTRSMRRSWNQMNFRCFFDACRLGVFVVLVCIVSWLVS